MGETMSIEGIGRLYTGVGVVYAYVGLTEDGMIEMREVDFVGNGSGVWRACLSSRKSIWTQDEFRRLEVLNNVEDA